MLVEVGESGPIAYPRSSVNTEYGASDDLPRIKVDGLKTLGNHGTSNLIFSTSHDR